MALEIGTKLAHYEIVEPIGKGGMGEVFRAKDSKLGRDVAIKVLPDEFAENDERLARFRREAKVLASLNHPGIAAIHGLEESESTHYLVLELVPGETLAERIARGSIPVEEALDIAVKIAAALEEAHEHGIVHRDLKPANIKLTPDDKIKVLDFGLAKAFAEETPDADSSMSPTITRDATRMGVILGTAAYMSPEQAKGKRVDKRTDIFAFGAVVYEMLTGTKAFPGEDVSETLAAVIRAEPNWSQLPRIPASVNGLLRRCLDKVAQRRLRDIGEARLTLESTDFEIAGSPRGRQRGALVWVATSALGVGILLGAIAVRSLSSGADASPAAVVRFDIRVPESTNGHFPSVLAMARDESQLVFVRVVGETPQLYRRVLAGDELVPIEGTVGGSAPFLSPDGEWLGFHAEGQLKKGRLSGGLTSALCDQPVELGASWGDNDRIVYASEGALWDVPSAGGAPRRLTGEPSDEASSRILSWPEVLPGSRAVLFTESFGEQPVGGGTAGSQVGVVSLETGEERILIDDAVHLRFAAPRHALFVRDDTLWAVPFDVRSLEIAGEAVPVLRGAHAHGSGGAQFAISPNGSLIYSSGTGSESRVGGLVFVDRSGGTTPLPHEPSDYLFPRISPDGHRLAISKGNPSEWDIWVLDVDRPARTRLTFDLTGDSPVWTPDGRRIAYNSRATGVNDDLYWTPADGTGDAEPLLERKPLAQKPYDFSPDGGTLLYMQTTSTANIGELRRLREDRDIWTLTLGEEPKPFVATSFNEQAAVFSPDGHWVAYTSNASGRTEVYVRSYPDPGAAILVSTNGGTEPGWSPQGGELFFRDGNKMMAVPMRLEPELQFGVPERLFEGSYRQSQGVKNYDVTSDGQRFLMVTAPSNATTAQIHVVLNWLRELERLVPVE